MPPQNSFSAQVENEVGLQAVAHNDTFADLVRMNGEVLTAEEFRRQEASWNSISIANSLIGGALPRQEPDAHGRIRTQLDLGDVRARIQEEDNEMAHVTNEERLRECLRKQREEIYAQYDDGDLPLDGIREGEAAYERRTRRRLDAAAEADIRAREDAKEQTEEARRKAREARAKMRHLRAAMKVERTGRWPSPSARRPEPGDEDVGDDEAKSESEDDDLEDGSGPRSFYPLDRSHDNLVSFFARRRKNQTRGNTVVIGGRAEDQLEPEPVDRMQKVRDLFDCAAKIQASAGIMFEPMQREFFREFAIACGPAMFGEHWPSVQLEFMMHFGLARHSQNVLAVTPRRFGKTWIVCMFVLAFLLVNPRKRVVIIGQTKRTSVLLLKLMKSFLSNNQDWKRRIASDSTDHLSILPEGLESLSAKDRKNHPELSTVYALPSTADGTSFPFLQCFLCPRTQRRRRRREETLKEWTSRTATTTNNWIKTQSTTKASLRPVS